MHEAEATAYGRTARKSGAPDRWPLGPKWLEVCLAGGDAGCGPARQSCRGARSAWRRLPAGQRPLGSQASHSGNDYRWGSGGRLRPTGELLVVIVLAFKCEHDLSAGINLALLALVGNRAAIIDRLLGVEKNDIKSEIL